MQESAATVMASKIVRELFRLSQAYGQPLGSSFDDLLHDLALMIRHDDLEAVRLVLHDAQRRTLLEYAYHIRAGKVESGVPQHHVGGLAVVPLPEPFSLTLLISRHGTA